MISRILFIALEDRISVVSLSEKRKSTQIPFDGEIIFKIQENFWSNWCAQTSYIAPKSEDDSTATICDFCFIMDKEYSFAKADFLDKVIMVKESFWEVEKLKEVLKSLDIVKQYHEVVIKMPNDVSFSVIGNKDASAVTINAVTNISDMEYKLLLEEKSKQKEKKKVPKRKEDVVNQNEIIVSKSKVKRKSSKKKKEEESPLVKYNKSLLAEEKSNE